MKYSLLSKFRSELMGIAMIAVMLFHATDLGTDLNGLDQLRSLGFGGVDIFILLSGVGLAMSLSKREQTDAEFLSRRAWRVLPAYYAVMLPYTLFLYLAGRAQLSTFLWNSILLNYWVGCMGGFNWYVGGIMLLYLVTPPVFRFLRSHRRRAPILLAVTAAAFFVTQVLMRDTWWNHLDVFFRIPVYVAGLVIGLWIVEERKFTAADGAALAVMLLAGVVYALNRMSMGDYAPGAYIFTLITVPVCLGLAWLMDKLPLRPLYAALRFLGENSLEIYLLNVSLFSETALLRRFFDPGPGHYVYYAAAFALNILLGWALHKAVGVAVNRLRRRRGSDRPIKF